MAGRFPLYTDADVHGPLILALRPRGWDLIRAIDLYPPGRRMRCTASVPRGKTACSSATTRIWRSSRTAGSPTDARFRGLILLPQEHYKRMGYAELAAQIEALSEPFPHPVIHLRPAR